MSEKPEINCVFYITDQDVYEIAKEMNVPREKITPEVLAKVAEALNEGLDKWSYIVQDALSDAFENEEDE